MKDIFELPSERELPFQTKAAVRHRILAEIGTHRRSRTRGALVPAAIAAGVLIAAAGAAGLVDQAGHGARSTPAAAVPFAGVSSAHLTQCPLLTTGPTVRPDPQETICIGTRDGNLDTLVLNRTPNLRDPGWSVTVANPNATTASSSATAPNPYAFGTIVDYRHDANGDVDYAIVGLLKSSQVAKVELVAPGHSAILGAVRNGMFVVPGLVTRGDGARASSGTAYLVLSTTSNGTVARLPVTDR